MKAKESLNRHRPTNNASRNNNQWFVPRNNWQTCNLSRAADPNTMDMSVDRVCARLAGAKDITQMPRNLPFPPRGRPRQGFQQGRRPQRDLRDVICFSCQRPGHLSRNCLQPQGGSDRQGGTANPIIVSCVQVTVVPQRQTMKQKNQLNTPPMLMSRTKTGPTSGLHK